MSQVPSLSSCLCTCAGRGHSCSPLKRLKPSEDVDASTAGNNAASPGACVDSDDAELARKLHEQLNGPDSPTAAPITRHITRVRKAPTFYKPEVQLASRFRCNAQHPASALHLPCHQQVVYVH